MRWNSIRTKLITFMLIATIVPTVATMVISYSYTTDSLKRRAIQENHQLIFQGKTNLANFLENINRASLTVYTDFEFFRQLSRGYDDYTFESYSYITLQNIAASMRDIWQVYLYRNEVKRATLVIQNVPRRLHEQEPNGPAVEYARDGIGMQPTHLSQTYGFATSPYYFPSVQVFSLHRKIYRVPSKEEIGVLSIDVKVSALADIIDQLFQRDKEHIYLLNDEGDVFYAGDRRLIGQRLHEDWYAPSDFRNNGNGHFEKNDSIFIHERIETPIANWTLVKQIPQSYLLREANRAAVINMLLIALSLVVIIAATIIVSLRITKPISQLVRYINQVQTGNLRVDIQPVSNDEIGVVSKRFRNMMDMINNLILREYQLEIANKTNQLKALQAQINPHFINNALQSIGTQALQLNAPHIYKLVTALAKMMRYSMYTDQSIVTLREEIEHVKAYLQLQAQRFENTFEAAYENEAATLNVLVPKMTLQPLVENYFKHGLDRGLTSGKLIIRSRFIDEPDGLVELIVEDNGRGMPLQRRIELNEKLRELHPEQPGTSTTHALSRSHFVTGEASSGIGLVNVLIRLKLFSSGNADMRVEAAEPQGTRIVIHMKMERDES
ncbi:cache domain-containing sensor histidine kinase [Paenibacillus apiarius]|uniref:Histidine kinase n=1 Tax=Paenibacillus apiarius TaxID=46240 RepID=A0ABT4DRH8_9BACL|nr:histidine kinase [Paenibacillus apiarius]MCY9515567.1 histidine kinase [Paenibacillus apiarius]MCY9519360.1 histidine kinase [Paenibacillus apiarius]MCY9550996.1 histidine kinase [Paenibacillus apiarius]MCY9558912.1 histidine kinase [Paenibacillus apiarius]MCY9683611.1 histidine kinase [Paenibacillus apiarius]